MTWNYETKTIKDENYFYEFCEELESNGYELQEGNDDKVVYAKMNQVAYYEITIVKDFFYESKDQIEGINILSVQNRNGITIDFLEAEKAMLPYIINSMPFIWSVKPQDFYNAYCAEHLKQTGTPFMYELKGDTYKECAHCPYFYKDYNKYFNKELYYCHCEPDNTFCEETDWPAETN